MQNRKINKLRCRSVSVIILLTLFLCFYQTTAYACENERTQKQIVVPGQDKDTSETEEGNKPVREYEIGTITSSDTGTTEPEPTGLEINQWIVGAGCFLLIVLLATPLLIYGLRRRRRHGTVQVKELEIPTESVDIPVDADWVTLVDMDNPQRQYSTPLQTKIVVGREEGDIRLQDNPEASKVQFELIKIGDLYYMKDLKSASGTFYQGMRTKGRTPVISGGILEIGTTRYRLVIEKRQTGTPLSYSEEN